jgi:hypothetical protein
VPEHHVEAGISVERRLLKAQLARREAVVSVEKGVEISGGVLDGTVTGRAVASILLGDHRHLREAPGDLGCAIRRAVVDHDQLDRLVVLRQDALDRLAEIGGSVVRADHHAQERLHESPSSTGGSSRASFARSERRSGS